MWRKSEVFVYSFWESEIFLKQVRNCMRLLGLVRMRVVKGIGWDVWTAHQPTGHGCITLESIPADSWFLSFGVDSLGMAVEFNPSRYEDKFISDLVGFVAADEFQTLFEHFFLTYAIEFTGFVLNSSCHLVLNNSVFIYIPSLIHTCAYIKSHLKMMKSISWDIPRYTMIFTRYLKNSSRRFVIQKAWHTQSKF